MVEQSGNSDTSTTTDMVPQSDPAVNNYSMQNSAEDASGKHSLMDIANAKIVGDAKGGNPVYKYFLKG